MKNRQSNDAYKWIVLAISFLMMMCFSLSLQALPPLFEQIMIDVPFSNAQAGILMGAYAIPGIFLPFLVAYLANKYDLKKLITIALLIMIAGLVGFSLSNSFVSLVVYRLVAGVGVTVLVVIAPLLVTMFFNQKNIGIAMGIFNVAVPTATVLAANFFGPLGQSLGWRNVLLSIAGFLTAVLIFVGLFYSSQKNENNINSNSSNKEPTPKFKGNLSLWFLSGIWVLSNFQLLAYVTFGPQFYQSLGISSQQAGFLTSLIMVGSIFLAPIIGIAFDKTGREKGYLILGNAIIFLSFLAMASNFSGLSLWASILGVGFSPMAVFVFAYLPRVVKTHEVGMGMGMLTVASNLGTTIGPSSIGSILDNTGGNFFIAFMALAFISLLIIIFALALKERTSP